MANELRCEWDARKARENKRKHEVSFEEAETVFLDEHGILLDDPDESKNEERFLLLGMSAVLRLLVVSHCVRGEGSVLRIISARRANKAEQAEYWDRVKR